MRKLALAALYTALTFGANPAPATDLAPYLQGDMAKLVATEPPVPLPDIPVHAPDGSEHALREWQGKWVVLNFWATWCAPCRREMPSLDRLQAAFPGIAVLPVATGRNPPAAVDRFFTEAGITGLPKLYDPNSALARASGVMGLPVTLIINPEGQEVARLIGDAAWDSPEARALFTALTAAP